MKGALTSSTTSSRNAIHSATMHPVSPLKTRPFTEVTRSSSFIRRISTHRYDQIFKLAEINGTFQNHPHRIVPCRSNVLSITTHAPRISSIATRASNLPIDALIFDCDGVIVESEDIHREAYNAAFNQFDIRCPNDTNTLVWTEEFYDMLQNKVGGGKPKMRWYFGEYGWPTSSLLDGKTPSSDQEKDLLIDTLQDWKTDKYKEIIGSGEIKPREGILELMDAARAAGVPVAVCSASTKAACLFVMDNLLGKERFETLDLFMAGDDVPFKKPDPTIYKVAAERLQVDPSRCIVVEDSMVGLAAAVGAGMKCVITYTNSTASQEFDGAVTVLSGMGGVSFETLASGKLDGVDTRRIQIVA